MRLLRLIRILPQLQKVSEYGIAMLLLLVSVFGLVGHWLACVFYAIAYLERTTLPDPKYSWLDHLAEKYNMPYRENNSDSGPDLKSKYITALFFTLTSLTSVGFGNVSPTTNWEKIFSIMSMMLGSLISAAIFGNVTTIMYV
jgi:potassium voltage-gated channel Eag-related subfamily H member 2